jgi:hypothetical protein
MGHFSALAGAVSLAVIVVPVVVRTTEDMLLLVPDPLREAASALGLPRAIVIGKVAYRAARAGLITGVLLAIARISGETAPLLFTALNNQFFSTNLNAPMASLPVVIFQFALSPYKEWQQLAWTGALLITLAVLCAFRARVLQMGGLEMSGMNDVTNLAQGQVAGSRAKQARPRCRIRRRSGSRPQILLWRSARLEEHQRSLSASGDGLLGRPAAENRRFCAC